MAPPRATEFSVDDIGLFDDEALSTFLDPRDGGVDPALLGIALQPADPRLIDRVVAALPGDAAAHFSDSLAAAADDSALTSAQRDVMELLFWPLVYWNDPDDYEELISGEHLHPRLLEAIDLDGRTVCDIGAGTGRFSLAAAPRANRIIAVDAVPQLLRRLEAKAAAAGINNIEVRRGRFTSLPLPDGSVDIAVACSSFTTGGPHGGDTAINEAQRVVRRGGDVVVIWPQDPQWFLQRGFQYIAVHGERAVHFRNVATAERLCKSYYSADAADWVRTNNSAEVPFSVLGMSPPSDLCIKRVE
ncbi:MAG TPA: class I SAM-dependent methyltransferase [Candidatus Acidoferrales bacterium]|nr:class I SAM-dependent methyltransferase [Candidatus Acidoferrales bacterium]